MAVMSAITPFPQPPKGDDSEPSSPEAARLLKAIWELVPLLPVADQQRLADEIVRVVRPIPAFRSGDVLGSVVRFLPKQPQWTAKQIREQVAASGVQATSREVFNAIGYLIRKGRVKRLGNGQYLVDGAGLTTTDNLGLEPTRYEEDG